MLRFLVKLCKGMLIGMSVVIPGVSGGSMAVSMGIYDQIIDFTTARRDSRKKGVGLLPFGIGIILGVLVFAFFIERMFARFPLQTAFLFVGMILGAMPMLLMRVRGQAFRVSHAILLLSTITIMVLMPIASKNAGLALTLLPDAKHALIALLLGFAAAATLIVPGVSGSMLLILLGYYEPVLQYVNAFSLSVLQLDFASMGNSVIILMPFAIGALLGVVVMSRLIKLLLRRYPCATYYAIMGLVLASPFAVLWQQSFRGIQVLDGIVCVALLAVGFFIAMLLGRGEQ